MASFTTGKKASSSLAANKSVSTGSFKVKARLVSSETGKAVSSFKTLATPKSTFANVKNISSSFSTSNKPGSSFKTSGSPTPIPVNDIKIKPVNKFTDVKTETNIQAKVRSFKGTLVKPTKPVDPYRTISFKQTTAVKPIKTETVRITPVDIKIQTKIKPVSDIDVVGKVKAFKGTLIKKPVTVPTNPIKAAVKSSKSSSSGSSEVWGGTGSLKATGGLSSAEKERKGITGSAYTQGSDKTPRNAKSYNTGKTEKM
jgi:hypothetical protein